MAEKCQEFKTGSVTQHSHHAPTHTKERKTLAAPEAEEGGSKGRPAWSATEEEIDIGYDYLLDNLPEQDDRLAQQRWLLKKHTSKNTPISGWPKGYDYVHVNRCTRLYTVSCCYR